MKRKINIKLPLTKLERVRLRANKVRIAEIPDLAVEELVVVLAVSLERAKELHALADFQRIPSIGIKFAEDLVFLGYCAINELRGEDGAALVEVYERKKGYWIDPCVEDQFRLAVYCSETGDYTRNWWDFTEERKQYRRQFGYPADRPESAWYEVVRSED